MDYGYLNDIEISEKPFMWWSEKRKLVLQAKRIPDMLMFYEKYDCCRIYISGTYFREVSLEFLLEFKDIMAVDLYVTRELKDISVLYKLNQLQELQFLPHYAESLPKSSFALELDFAKLTQLNSLALDCKFRFRNLELICNLSFLMLIGCEDGNELPNSLGEILMSRTKRTNLEFLKAQTRLSAVEIYGGKITNIDGLIHVRHSLKSLKMYNCSKIENIDVLESLDNLELLGLESFSKEAKLRYAPVLERLEQKGVTIKYYW